MAIIDAASVHINYPGCNKTLRSVKSVSTSDDQTTEIVTALGSKRGVGFKQSAGGLSLTFEVLCEKKPEVDYRWLKRKQWEFALTIELAGGFRLQYPRCKVSTVTISASDDGEVMDSVEIVATDEQPA
jgi:hypothetical protein